MALHSRISSSYRNFKTSVFSTQTQNLSSWMKEKPSKLSNPPNLEINLATPHTFRFPAPLTCQSQVKLCPLVTALLQDSSSCELTPLISHNTHTMPLFLSHLSDFRHFPSVNSLEMLTWVSSFDFCFCSKHWKKNNVSMLCDNVYIMYSFQKYNNWNVSRWIFPPFYI